MEKKKNFLDVLQEEFDEMLEQGIVDEETLKDGLMINFKSIVFSDINASNMARTLGGMLKKVNPSYVKNSMFSVSEGNTVNREHIYNPDTITRFALKRNTNGKMYIEVDGKDNSTKYFITNDKNPNSTIDEFSPEQFFEEYIKTERNYEKSKMQTDMSLSDEMLQYITKCIYKPQKNNILLEGLNVSFNEMMFELGAYCRYLLDPKYDMVVEEKDENEGNIIQGGIIIQREDTGSARKLGNGVGSSERKNEIYSFEERAKILEDLNPDKKIVFDSFDEDGKIIGKAYTTYVYSNPRDLGGYLFFTEPNDGNKSARAVYVSDERMKTFLQDGEEVDDTKLREISEKYLEMSNKEFKDEKFTYSFNHWKIENYRERLNQVIGGIDSQSYSIKFDSKRIAKQIYFGEKPIKDKTIKNAVSGVSTQQINEAEEFLNAPVQQIDNTDKTTDEQGGQEV